MFDIWRVADVAKHYRIDNTPKLDRIPSRYRDARRGAIPQVESPEDKIRRLRASGYQFPRVRPHDPSEVSDFLGLDLGNKELPAYKHKQEIIDTIEQNRITLLTGPTGSGKTTQLAQYALEAGYDKIVYLLPRRVNVDNNADFVTKELAEQIGEDRAKELVGAVHSMRAEFSDKSRIIFMTAGTYTRMAGRVAEEWQGMKTVIVADEMHENGKEIEFASALAVRQAEKDDDLRIVFASATPDYESMKGYQPINGAPVPVVEIEGRPHDLKFHERPDLDIVEAYFEYSAGSRVVPIFVPGKRDAKQVISLLRSQLSPEEEQLTKFFLFHAKVSTKAQQAVFDMKLEPGERAVVVTTSALQSGVTIPGGTRTVITCGLTKSPELDREDAPGLPIRLCTQAEITQQGGRAGRDIDGGQCILARLPKALYKRDQSNPIYEFVPIKQREPSMPPEIYHTNISGNVLTATVIDGDFFTLNNYLKNSVSQRTIHESYELLYKLGAVDGGNQATDLGRLMEMFPLRPELSRATAEVVYGYSLQTTVNVLAIAAAIEAGRLGDIDGRPGLWWQNLRMTTDDDFIAELDLMKRSRRHYHRDSVDETTLSNLGIDFKNAYTAHRQFDKMLRLIGLKLDDVDFESYPTETEEDEIREIFLKGMPELLFEKKHTYRSRGIYHNIWGYEQAVSREISRRSLLNLGQSAVKLVAGYPRWYTDSRGNHFDIIDTGFAVSKSQVASEFGWLAAKDLGVDVRAGKLVRSGSASLGSLSLGKIKAFESKARTESECKMLVDNMLYSDTAAVNRLVQLGIGRSEIRRVGMEVAMGGHSAQEIDSRLWQFVAQLQAE